MKNPPSIKDQKTTGRTIKNFYYIQRNYNLLTSLPTPNIMRLQRIHNLKPSPNEVQRSPLSLNLTNQDYNEEDGEKILKKQVLEPLRTTLRDFFPRRQCLDAGLSIQVPGRCSASIWTLVWQFRKLFSKQQLAPGLEFFSAQAIVTPHFSSFVNQTRIATGNRTTIN